ncbi:uncharacterized protein LOC111711255 isoform X1 [Eurytemora carolleeae]|uniref:uncharacterized protein LOC111711255 isoform X1 n=1 Tax=Eurytemora carolleeae TaxID=1294199 RepID=UPI000C76194E|nr:uncharacterized protein LOC111711255 isoform X1 [Eurytemora carolleeae]|eukprot:XP_023341321.1 uncharacterized protein LOC111711255 isoform X1 [Eurytemora affinis]
MKEMLKINCRLYYRIKQFKNQFIVICLLSLIIVSSLLKSEEPPVGNITVHDLPKCSSTDKLDLNKDMRAAELVQFSEDGSKIKGPFIYRPYLNCLNQEDDRLTDLIRDEYIRPPNNKLLYLNGMEVNSDTAYEITRNEQVVDITELVYKNQVPRNGFYLEAGSHDGINSMSFEFELVHNWTGVLVEADVWLYTHSLELNRKSYQIHTCLAVEKTPHFGMFDMVSAVRGKGLYSMGGLSSNPHEFSMQMQCFPLYSIIKALGNPVINLLILDVEGAEQLILETLPWDKVDIEIMTVETDLVGKSISGGSQSQASIRALIESKGYRRYPHRMEKNEITGLEQNDLFIREDIVKKYNVTDYPIYSKSNENRQIVLKNLDKL